MRGHAYFMAGEQIADVRCGARISGDPGAASLLWVGVRCGPSSGAGGRLEWRVITPWSAFSLWGGPA